MPCQTPSQTAPENKNTPTSIYLIIPITSPQLPAHSALITDHSSQQLQVSRHAINNTLGRGPNAQHRVAAAGNLRAAGISNDLRHEAQAEGRGLQRRQLVLALDLQRDLGLAGAFPAA